ncbi:MAG: methionine synthase [Campylobacterales bacterium]|nr:methionine synthase [Campylobacterales bacterium]
MKKSPIRNLIEEKILIIDGAMGSLLQEATIPDSAWEGKEGCNELLNTTAPEVIKDIHRQYLNAGADLTKTNTFGAFDWVLDEYEIRERAYELALNGTKIAKEVCNEFTDRPRYVLGSIGPGTKLPSLGHMTYDEMYSGYCVTAKAMIEGGVDVFLLETCQDPLQIKAGLHACEDMKKEADVDIPIMVSVTIETSGTMLIGTDAKTIATILQPFDILTLGLNCGTGPREMTSHLKVLSENWNGRISVHGNAGLPENVGGCTVYPMKEDEFSELESAFVEIDGLSAFGGCCGTTPKHIEALAKKLEGLKPSVSSATIEPSLASLFETRELVQEPAPFLIGERSNATGSKAFRELLLAEDYEGTLTVAQQQVKGGAHGIDISVGFAGRDETKDMEIVASLYAQKISLPLMVDTTQPKALEAGLKQIGGRPIINSVNLEDGIEKFDQICSLAKRFGAVLVCLTIDEKGMAKSGRDKFEIGKRLVNLAKERHGLKEEDLVVDTLVFTVGSGDDEFKTAAMETIEGIKLLKAEFPKIGFTLGVSNISFGLDKHAREYLNSVFLHHCVNAGLSTAIINVKHVIPLAQMEKKDIQICEDLLFNKHDNALFDFIEHFSDDSKKHKREEKDISNLPTDEKIKVLLLDGDKKGMLTLLETAKDEIDPSKIVNEILLDGMKVIGELFGSGKMQLPFVLQSAEVMKASVDFLNPYLPKTTKTTKTTLLLGTVKGDVHDVGKNLVDIILSNNGFEVRNIGIKADIDAFIEEFKKGGVDAIGMSGLLVKSTQVMMENLIELKKEGIDVPILLGGAALTKGFIDEYCRPNYDGHIFYCKDAFDGIEAMGQVESGDFTSIEKIEHDVEEKPKQERVAVEIDPAKIEMPETYPDLVTPPFLGRRVFTDYKHDVVFDWINHKGMFSRSWGYKPKGMEKEEYEKLLEEEVKPNYQRLKKQLLEEGLFDPTIIYGYYKVKSENGKLRIFDDGEEVYAVDFPRQKRTPHRAISDYFRSEDILPVSIVSAGSKIVEYEQKLYKEGKFHEYYLVHGMATELAEAMAEVVHKQIRIDLGITQGKEEPSLDDVKMSHYQGKRYSFGYGACPELADNQMIFKLLKPEEFRIELTETFQMVPEHTTSALVTYHPEAVYYTT